MDRSVQLKTIAEKAAGLTDRLGATDFGPGHELLRDAAYDLSVLIGELASVMGHIVKGD